MIKINKNLIIAGSIVVLIAVAVVMYFVFGTGGPSKLVSVEVKNGDITEKINLTGQVRASQGVDLAFSQQGQVTASYVKVGDTVYAGQSLAAIDSSNLQAQLLVSQAQLDALDSNVVQSKNNAAMQSAYASGLAASQKSVSLAKDVVITLFDIQSVSVNTSLWDAKGKVVESLLGQGNAGFWGTQQIADLNGGAFGLVQTAVNNPTQDDIDNALSATLKALQDIRYFINTIPVDPWLSVAEKSVVMQEKTAINLEIITTSNNIQVIALQKVNNSATISGTNSQIEAAKANVNAVRTQISKTVLTAPFSGQIAKDDISIGAIASPNVPVITVSNNNLEIDTNIPEINVAGAKIGDNADVTLDAFGNNTVFPVTIISIDSTTSIVGGIPVYGAKLKFTTAESGVKPGMTANIEIISATHKNVLAVPISSVIQNNNNYFVVIDNGNSKKETRQVTIGLRDDKNIEIVSGLKLGEKVFAY
jgi:HlyD family secretion protein